MNMHAVMLSNNTVRLCMLLWPGSDNLCKHKFLLRGVLTLRLTLRQEPNKNVKVHWKIAFNTNY